MKNSNVDFFIHYENKENSNELELKVLCESLIGFELLLKEIFKISKIQGNLEVKAKASKNGSYVEWLILGIDLFNSMPFLNLHDFLNFIQIVDLDLHKEAVIFFRKNTFDLEGLKLFFNSIVSGNNKFEKILNDFATNRPVAYDATKFILGGSGIGGLLFYFLKSTIFELKSIKNKQIPSKEMPKSFFSPLKKIIAKGKVKKAMNPFVEGQAERIGFSMNGKNINEESIINRKNFYELLPDKEMILTDYINGQKYNFNGKIVNFHGSRGEFMKVKVDLGKDGEKLLVVRPDEEHSIKDFREFYGENVIFEAEVLRETLFEKPKLKVIGEIELSQRKML